MRQTRLLITTYYTAFLQPGGGETELLNLAESLRSPNMHVDVYGATSSPLASYSTVLHFSVDGNGIRLVEEVKALNKKLILWPNLWWLTIPSNEQLSQTKQFFTLADKIIFKSYAELENVSQYIDIDTKKIVIIPWGVDPVYMQQANPFLFKSLYRLDSYILWLGIIEKQKNQLRAIKALRNIEVPIIFIGHHRNEDYFNACLEAAPDHFKFLPYMPHGSPILRSALQNCDLYLEVPLEPPGLSALEAGLMGKQSVLSKSTWTTEEFGDMAISVDPTLPDEILLGVEEGLSKKNTNENNLVKRIMEKHILPHCLKPLINIVQGE
jgi:glycosyltransferase involved in cell wall biosynthesis